MLVPSLPMKRKMLACDVIDFCYMCLPCSTHQMQIARSKITAVEPVLSQCSNISFSKPVPRLAKKNIKNTVCIFDSLSSNGTCDACLLTVPFNKQSPLTSSPL